jgi:hypothetical protein
MGLFDLFSNDTAEEAARQRNQGLQQGYDALSQNFGQGRTALSGNLATGRDALTGNLAAGRDVLSGDYGQGRDAASANYGAAGNLYAGLGDYFKQQYGGGANAYGDATGANGAEGFGRAQTNFRTDPGYGFQMDQGLQALQRTHAASGNLASGNADADTLKFSQGLADQSYGNYVSRLAPYLQLAGAGQTTATAGQAGALQHLGNTLDASYRGEGGANASSYGTQGAGLNASYAGEGAGLNASLMGQGQSANTNYTGQGASNAAATMNNYNVGQNQLNALVSAGKLGASLFGGF